MFIFLGLIVGNSLTHSNGRGRQGDGQQRDFGRGQGHHGGKRHGNKAQWTQHKMRHRNQRSLGWHGQQTTFAQICQQQYADFGFKSPEECLNYGLQNPQALVPADLKQALQQVEQKEQNEIRKRRHHSHHWLARRNSQQFKLGGQQVAWPAVCAQHANKWGFKNQQECLNYNAANSPAGVQLPADVQLAEQQIEGQADASAPEEDDMLDVQQRHRSKRWLGRRNSHQFKWGQQQVSWSAICAQKYQEFGFKSQQECENFDAENPPANVALPADVQFAEQDIEDQTDDESSEEDDLSGEESEPGEGEEEPGEQIEGEPGAPR